MVKMMTVTSFSMSSSSEISSSFSSFFLSFFNTKPGGRAWRYIQVSPAFGHTQNQPYLLFSMASRKYLHTCKWIEHRAEAQLIERINASPWYAIQVDESTDVDNRASRLLQHSRLAIKSTL